MTKWGVQSYLAGVDTVKIGFVTRKNIQNNQEHILVGFHDTEPHALLALANFNPRIAWGMISQIVEIMQNQPDGKYIIMKTLSTAKQTVRIFRAKASEREDID